MKKNKMMRTASGFLVATLLTTSVISGTFAKYTTTASGSDSARVAYWGFNQNANMNIDLFDGRYDTDHVKSADGDNVVAPGTTKTATFAFGYDGNTAENASAPEVAYKLTVDATATGSHTNLDSNDSFKWTLQAPNAAQATEYDNVDALLAAIKALSGDPSGSKEYAAGELPTTFTTADETYIVGWKWAFDGNDTKDTEMGNATSLDDVGINITITATQVD